jgi:serine/threonine protein phosphatase PrpC
MLHDLTSSVYTKAIEYGGRSMNFAQLILSVRGQGHQTKRLPNQDFATGWLGDHQYGIAVGDGLGSCRLSHLGSKQAVYTVKQMFTQRRLFQDEEAISAGLVSNWRKEILQQSNGLKSFDSTMLFASLEEDGLIVGKLGDGMIQWKLGSTVKGELVDDEHLFGNLTHSLAMRHSEKYFMMEKIPLQFSSIPIGILLTTDGISSDLKPEIRSSLVDVLTNQIITSGPDSVFAELKEWIVNWLTPMHTDDRTIAFMAIWDKEDEHAR